MSPNTPATPRGLWISVPVAHPAEGLPSLIARLARHRRVATAEVLRALGHATTSPVASSLVPTSGLREAIGVAFGIGHDQLSLMRLPRSDDWEWPQAQTYTRAVPFCAPCLQEKPGVVPLSWHLVGFPFCLRHRTVLRRSCPQCHAPAIAREAFERALWNCPHCSADLRQAGHFTFEDAGLERAPGVLEELLEERTAAALGRLETFLAVLTIALRTDARSLRGPSSARLRDAGLPGSDGDRTPARRALLREPPPQRVVQYIERSLAYATGTRWRALVDADLAGFNLRWSRLEPADSPLRNPAGWRLPPAQWTDAGLTPHLPLLGAPSALPTLLPREAYAGVLADTFEEALAEGGPSEADLRQALSLGLARTQHAPGTRPAPGDAYLLLLFTELAAAFLDLKGADAWETALLGALTTCAELAVDWQGRADLVQDEPTLAAVITLAATEPLESAAWLCEEWACQPHPRRGAHSGLRYSLASADMLRLADLADEVLTERTLVAPALGTSA